MVRPATRVSAGAHLAAGGYDERASTEEARGSSEEIHPVAGRPAADRGRSVRQGPVRRVRTRRSCGQRDRPPSGSNRHRLLRLTGLDAQENQARRMLNDIARFREAEERRLGRPLPDSVAASRWRQEVFEPTVAAVPDELNGRLPAAEVFHQVLEHRWFLSESAGKDVGIEEAVRAYVKSELPRRPPERVVLQGPPNLA